MTERDGAPLLLDVKAAAALLGMTEKALRHHVDRQLVPYRKLGGRVMFPRLELLAFVADLPGVRLDQARRNLSQRQRTTAETATPALGSAAGGGNVVNPAGECVQGPA